MSLRTLLFGPVESLFLQVPRALVASVVAAALDFCILIALVELFGWSPVPAAIVGYLAGGVVQYVLCSLWVFHASHENKLVGFAVFTVMSLVGLAITWAVMYCQPHVGVPYPAAKVLALGLAFVWNFGSRKAILFRSKSKARVKLAAAQSDAALLAQPRLAESLSQHEYTGHAVAHTLPT